MGRLWEEESIHKQKGAIFCCIRRNQCVYISVVGTGWVKQQEGTEWNKRAGGEMTKDREGWEEKAWEEELPGWLYKPHGCAKVKSEV